MLTYYFIQYCLLTSFRAELFSGIFTNALNQKVATNQIKQSPSATLNIWEQLFEKEYFSSKAKK